MARTERFWNQDFQSYMDEIANHPNYSGLSIERKRDGTLAWFAFANGEIGKTRKEWTKDKARELGFPVSYLQSLLPHGAGYWPFSRKSKKLYQRPAGL